MNWWKPDIYMKKIPNLHARARVLRAVRGFFDARGYLEVETPALQPAPCMEAHLQAFRTEIISPDGQFRAPAYLHTSPEFAMKKLLVAGLPAIYQLAKVYRNAEDSRLHSPEFTMLEWYRAGMSYAEMMEETKALVRHVCAALSRDAGEDVPLRHGGLSSDPRGEWEAVTVCDALEKYAGVRIAGHLGDLAHIRGEARRAGVYVSDHDDWDNALLKIIMEKVEPRLGHPAPTILYDYPASMAALARLKPEDPRLAERFEVYACGVELANGFGELTDAAEQRRRFTAEVTLRKKLYGQDYPVEEDFLRALEHGLPACSGNALGLDRLVMLATGAADIADVQAAPVGAGR